MGQAFIGRRAFLALTATSLLRVPGLHAEDGKGSSSVYSPHHFLDAATEFDLFRLTDPQVASVMTAPHLRSIARRGRFLVYAAGVGAQVHRLDWRSGESRQLTAAAALDPASIALAGDDRSIFFFDGPALRQVMLSGLRDREVARVADGWQRTGFSLSSDGLRAAWAERQDGHARIRAVATARGEAETVLEKDGAIADVQIRPQVPGQVFYRLDGKPHLAGTGGADRAWTLAAGGASTGTMGQALWSPSGETVLYLWLPDDPKQLVTLREYAIEDQSDKLVAKTSQFGSFGVNADSSVFVGASRSLASPYVLLLVRSVRRELTLCEHRATDSKAVNPIFSPDSQSVFFVSDRQGKSAIYRAHVEKFVEETE